MKSMSIAANERMLAGDVSEPKSKFKTGLSRINQELWLVLSLFVIAGLVQLAGGFSPHDPGPLHAAHDFLCLRLWPQTCRAHRQRQHLPGLILLWKNTGLFSGTAPFALSYTEWSEIVTWACLLQITAYAMGTLYDKKERHMGELRQTYFGLLTILQQFISNDKYTHNHSYRVAFYASSIATQMGFDQERVDDVRAAAMLHDVGKLETSRQLLYKAASLTPEEMLEMRKHVQKGVALLEPVGGSLRRVLPIILAHHDKFDGSGYGPAKGDEIPLEARVLAVADAFDTLTSDRPYRRAVTPFEAKQVIVSSAGANFDPAVVDAFVHAFEHGEMEIPEVLAI